MVNEELDVIITTVDWSAEHTFSGLNTLLSHYHSTSRNDTYNTGFNVKSQLLLNIVEQPAKSFHHTFLFFLFQITLLQ